MNNYNLHLDKLIRIYNEYNIFRLNTNINYNSSVIKNMLLQSGLSYEELLNIYQDQMQSGIPSAETTSYFERKFSGYFKYFLIEYNGKVAGQASIENFKERIVVLHRVYVKPEYRGKNLGWELLNKIFETAKNDNFVSIYLDTIPILKTAIHLYETIGFKRIDYYNGGDLTFEMVQALQSIFMEYSLKS